MACPTCDHSLALLIIADMERCFQCPRCGTTVIQRRKQFDSPFEEKPEAVYVPALVERCREFIAEVGDDKKHCRGFFPVDIKQHWHRLGIAESIHTPEKRRPT